jgi:hypothetical protein
MPDTPWGEIRFHWEKLYHRPRKKPKSTIRMIFLTQAHAAAAPGKDRGAVAAPDTEASRERAGGAGTARLVA